ncbi:hypothetical protein LguiB_005536 [Lonicera macranthoides]
MVESSVKPSVKRSSMEGSKYIGGNDSGLNSESESSCTRAVTSLSYSGVGVATSGPSKVTWGARGSLNLTSIMKDIVWHEGFLLMFVRVATMVLCFRKRVTFAGQLPFLMGCLMVLLGLVEGEATLARKDSSLPIRKFVVGFIPASGAYQLRLGDCYLPEDLLIDILSSLPVKSLLCCKCVCKDWYTLIQSPTLISKHFHHHNNLNRLLVHRCLYRLLDFHTNELVTPPKSVLSFFPNELLPEGAPLVHQVVDSPVGYRYFDVIGPVHGLFMVLCRRCLDPFWNGLALWNPATKELRALPLPSFDHQPPDCMWSGTNFGFGWDPSTGNYKVVWLQFSIGSNAVAALYTLATDSWRQLDLASTGLVSSVTGILFKRRFDNYTGRRICTYLIS